MTDPVEPDPFPEFDEFAALRESSTTTNARQQVESGPNIFEQISAQLGELDPRLVVGAGVAALGIVTIVGFIALLSLARGRPPSEQPTVVVAVTSQPTLTPSLTYTPSLTAIPSDTPAGPVASATVDIGATVTNLPELHFATLSEIKGSVEIRVDASAPFKRVNETLTITPGTTVLTGESSSAKVTLSDGSIVRLSSQTQFTIIELSGTESRPNSVLGLDFGKVWAIVGGIGEGIFQIKLPLGVASVRGTFMSAESNSNDKIEIIACLEGRCSYRNDNGQVLLGTLQQTESINGGPPTTPHRMDPNQIEDWNKLKIPEVTTLTPTSTIPPTRTPRPPATITPTPSNTSPVTATRTGTLTTTITATGSITATRTATITPSRTNTRTNTATSTASKTSTATNTATATNTPGPAHHLDFNIQPPSSVTSGQTFTVQVTIKDAAGRTVPYATNTITVGLGANPPDGTLSGTLSQPPVAGIATFNDLSLDDVGSGYVLQASASPSLPLPIVNSNSMSVTAGSIDHFEVVGPANVNRCTTFNVTVTAKDINNNTVTGYTGTVNFSVSDTDPNAQAPGGFNFTGSEGGTQSIGGFRFNSASGSFNANATDGSHGGSSGGISINGGSHGPASQMFVIDIPNPSTAGTPGPVTVHVKDACTNLATGYSSTVSFTSNDPIATLPAPSSLSAGEFTGSVTFNTTGTGYYVEASDGTFTAQQSGITVNP
jgi:hypothetical protein